MAEDRRERAESGVSDQSSCILCYSDIKFYAMGKCDHKNVCHKCSLRIRLVMKDMKCSMCKTELDEIVIASDQDLTWDDFEDTLKHKALGDKEDENIYYVSPQAKAAGMQLRSLQCLMYNCNSKQ